MLHQPAQMTISKRQRQIVPQRPRRRKLIHLVAEELVEAENIAEPADECRSSSSMQSEESPPPDMERLSLNREDSVAVGWKPWDEMLLKRIFCF